MDAATKHSFCVLYHYRATTGSDAALATVHGDSVLECEGETLLNFVRAAERILTPAVSTPRIVSSQLHLDAVAAAEGVGAARSGVKMGKECLAEAAATLEGGFFPDPPIVDRAFQGAMFALERVESARLADKVHVAWRASPTVKRAPVHFNQSLRESARIVELALAASPARELQERAMVKVVKHQKLVHFRYRALLFAAREAKRVLAAQPCKILEVLALEDVARGFAAFLPHGQAIMLGRTCRAMRGCEALGMRIPHIIFNPAAWPATVNNGILVEAATVFGVETEDNFERLPASRFFNDAPVLRVELLFDCPSFEKVGKVSSGDPIALQRRADHAAGGSAWSGCMRGDMWAAAPSMRVQAGVSSYASRGLFAEELLAASGTLEGKRMLQRNSERQLFRLRVHMEGKAKNGQGVVQSCLSPPFAVAKRKYAVERKASRAKRRLA